jgi:hypothetical protein
MKSFRLMAGRAVGFHAGAVIRADAYDMTGQAGVIVRLFRNRRA